MEATAPEEEIALPWREVSIVDQRAEFVALARGGQMPMRALCRRFEIAPATGYKWVHRAEEAGREGLGDRTRRPCSSPRKTPVATEALVLQLRDAHPAWGGRKIAARLRALGHDGVPSPSTVTDIMRRNGRLPAAKRAAHAWQRFERERPNELWQMDFKGHVPLGQGQGRLHPLTVLDDHSRYCLVLAACPDERATTVQDHLVTAFRRYGLPDGVLADNGGPWGVSAGPILSSLAVWLLQLGVDVRHGRPLHPQTQGKEERFHRTLKAELLQGPPYCNLAEAQGAFRSWRQVYNLERPHEACGLVPPVSRYRPSERPYPERLPDVEYGADFLVRRVRSHGGLRLKSGDYYIGEGLAGRPVGLLPGEADGVWYVYFSRFRIGRIDERDWGRSIRRDPPRPHRFRKVDS